MEKELVDLLIMKMYDIYKEIEKYDNNQGKSDDFEL